MIDLDSIDVATDHERSRGSDVAVTSDLDGYGRRLVGTIDHVQGLYGDNDYGYSYPFALEGGNGGFAYAGSGAGYGFGHGDGDGDGGSDGNGFFA
jgi:hypothetical protein